MPFVAFVDRGLIAEFVKRGYLPPCCRRFILDVTCDGVCKLYAESYAPDELQDMDLASMLMQPKESDNGG